MWEVSLSQPPVVQVPTPSFLQPGRSYELTWPAGGQSATYRVVARGTDGWVFAEPTGAESGASARWVNAALAMTIRELAP